MSTPAVVFTQDTLDTASVLDRALGPGRDAPPATPDPVPVPDPTPVPTPTPAPVTPDPTPAAPDPDTAALLESMAKLVAPDVVPPTPTPTPTPAPTPTATPAPVLGAELDAIELPAHARPNTAEAFGRLKATAKTSLAEAQRQIDELRTQLASSPAPPKAEDLITPELRAEIDELRRFRETAAIKGDPAYAAKFEKPVTETRDQIFAMLTAEGASPERIETIRKNGLESVDWEPVIGAMSTPANRARLRVLLSRHAEAVVAAEDASAKGTEFLSEFAKTQSAEREAKAKAERASARARYTEITGTIPALAPRQVPAGASPEVRASAEQVNRFVAGQVAQVAEVLEKGGPEDYAALAAVAAAAQVYHVQNQALVNANRALGVKLADALSKLGKLSAAVPPAPGRQTTPPTVVPKKGVESLPLGASFDDAIRAHRAALGGDE